MQINLCLLKTYIQYHIIGVVNKRIVPILIDTGASWSHISKEYCNNIFDLNQERTVECFDGSEKILKKHSKVLLQLQQHEDILLDILVDEEPNKIILGIDFLEQFRYIITTDYLLLNGSKQNRIKLSEEIINNRIQ